MVLGGTGNSPDGPGTAGPGPYSPVGGALGVAALTVILFHLPGRDGYAVAYLACGVCALLAAIASSGFAIPRTPRYRAQHRQESRISLARSPAR